MLDGAANAPDWSIGEHLAAGERHGVYSWGLLMWLFSGNGAIGHFFYGLDQSFFQFIQIFYCDVPKKAGIRTLLLQFFVPRERAPMFDQRETHVGPSQGGEQILLFGGPFFRLFRLVKKLIERHNEQHVPTWG